MKSWSFKLFQFSKLQFFLQHKIHHICLILKVNLHSNFSIFCCWFLRSKSISPTKLSWHVLYYRQFLPLLPNKQWLSTWILDEAKGCWQKGGKNPKHFGDLVCNMVPHEVPANRSRQDGAQGERGANPAALDVAVGGDIQISSVPYEPFWVYWILHNSWTYL